MINNEPTVLRKLYNSVVDKVLLSVFLSFLPAGWLTFVGILGKNFGLHSADGRLLQWVAWSVWISVLLCFIYSLAKAIGDKYNFTVSRHGTHILNSILKCINCTKIHKYTRIIRLIEGETDYVFCKSLCPKTQIQHLLDNLRSPLAELFALDSECVGLSVLYRYGSGSSWNLITTPNIENELTVHELTTNPKTTAMQLLSMRKATLFFPDKKKAFANDSYGYGPKDKLRNSIGSVLCHDISIHRRSIYVIAVLSITTYGQQICKDEDSEAEKKLNFLILPTISNPIRVELATLYISDTKPCKGRA